MCVSVASLCVARLLPGALLIFPSVVRLPSLPGACFDRPGAGSHLASSVVARPGAASAEGVAVTLVGSVLSEACDFGLGCGLRFGLLATIWLGSRFCLGFDHAWAATSATLDFGFVF